MPCMHTRIHTYTHSRIHAFIVCIHAYIVCMHTSIHVALGGVYKGRVPVPPKSFRDSNKKGNHTPKGSTGTLPSDERPTLHFSDLCGGHAACFPHLAELEPLGSVGRRSLHTAIPWRHIQGYQWLFTLVYFRFWMCTHLVWSSIWRPSFYVYCS